MVTDDRAMTWEEFRESGFDGREYAFPSFEGAYEAIIACKRWNKDGDLLVYLDFRDGRKVVTTVWGESNYLGIADMEVGTIVQISFRLSAKGYGYPRSAVRI